LVTDEQGLVLGVLTTPANVNEISNLESMLKTSGLAKGPRIYANKGYCSKKNRQLLKDSVYKDRILKKAVRGVPLTSRELLFNKLCSKVRFKAERTFGSIKRWFNSHAARYRGIDKMHTQNMMEVMVYNLYRFPGNLPLVGKNIRKRSFQRFF